MKTLFLTIRHQRVNSNCYCVAHDLSGQDHFHGTLSNGGKVGVSQLEQPTDHEVCFLFVYILSVFPLSNNRKLAVQMLSLKLTSYFRKRSWVHFQRCVGSYIVAVAWSWNWKNGSPPFEPNSYVALTLLVPMLQTAATTCSPTTCINQEPLSRFSQASQL
jgi:hypothetical protein